MSTDHTLNLSSFARFLTRRDSISLFLLQSLLMAVILVVFIQPFGILNHTTQRSSISPMAQVTLIASAGFLLVALSRVLLHFVNNRHEVSPLSCIIWVSVEFVLSIALAALTAWMVCGFGPLHLAPLAGNLVLGNMVVFLIPSVIAYQNFRIRELKSELAGLRAIQGDLGDGRQASADKLINFYDKGGRLALSTRLGDVLYVEAADNYTNIHYLNDGKEDTFILHNSMKDIERDYSSVGFMRCHRGYMVNVANVKLLKKDRSLLLLELSKTGRTIPVSKSYAGAVTRYFSGSM